MSGDVAVLDWPTAESTWWWMRCRPTPRSKWRVVLVRLVEAFGTEYVKPLGDRNCISRSICRDWEAQFYPAVGPPDEWIEQ